MRSASAGRVSRGGRRKSTAPPGSDIMRKSAASRALEASMLRIQEGNSPSAEIAHPRERTNTASANARVRLRNKLRKYVNLHLPRSNIVGDVLGGDGQLVSAGDHLFWNDQLASVGGSLRIPPEFDGRRPFQPRHQRARACRGLYLQGNRLAALETFAVELHLDHRRLAGDHKRLRLAIRLTQAIAQDEAHRVGSILHVGGSKEASLPDVFRGEIPQRLHQSERKQRHDRDDRFIGLHAQYGIARADDARPQQGAWYGQERSVGCDELVLAREADDFVNRGLIFAFTLDFFEQRVDAGESPEPRQLRMIERLAGKIDFARHLHRSSIAHPMDLEGHVLLRLLVTPDPRGQGS